MKRSKKYGIAMLLASPILLYSAYKIDQYRQNKCEGVMKNPSISRAIQLYDTLSKIDRRDKPNEHESLTDKLQNFQGSPVQINEYLGLREGADVREGMRDYSSYCTHFPSTIFPCAILSALGLGSIVLGIGNLKGIYGEDF